MTTRHLVIVSGNDSSLPVVPPPHTVVTLVQTADRGSPKQEQSVDRYLLVPEVTREVLVEVLGELHREIPITALVCFLEPVILEAARAAEDLGLRSNPLRAVDTARNKAQTRAALETAGVPQRPWLLCRKAEEAIAFRRDLGEPSIVLKPITGAGSAGVRMVRSDEEIRAHFEQIAGLHAWALLDNPDLMVLAEAALPGREVSVEAMTFDGVHEILQITDKKTTGEPRFVELGHRQPAEFDDTQRSAVRRRVGEVLDAIGHRIGPSHTEVMVDGSDVWLIETHTRFGGDQIWELTELTTGRHMATETIFSILDLPLPEPGTRQEEAAIAFMSWSTVEDAPTVPGVVRTKMPDCRTPERPEDLTDSSGRSGYVLAAGPGAFTVATSVVDQLQREF